jgi:mRNA-degrading endonuclease RelE of RelBE toxin-antitoxin system
VEYRVVLATSFKRCVKRYKKHYRSVREDARNAIDSILEDPQVGNVIPGGGGVRKLEVKNTDLQRGKKGGYRLLYSVRNDPEPTIYLILLYAKSDQADVTNYELRQLLNELD